MEKGISLFLKAARLKIFYEITLLTPAKEIKKVKLRQIIKDLKALKGEQEKEKELEFIHGNPKARVNYKIAGVIDSKEE